MADSELEKKYDDMSIDMLIYNCKRLEDQVWKFGYRKEKTEEEAKQLEQAKHELELVTRIKNQVEEEIREEYMGVSLAELEIIYMEDWKEFQRMLDVDRKFFEKEIREYYRRNCRRQHMIKLFRQYNEEKDKFTAPI